jgi:neutral ceramidase
LTLLAGAAAVDITPPLPMDVLGYVRRAVAPRRALEPLQATACVLQSHAVTIAVIGADLVGLSTELSDRIRERVAAAIDTQPERVLLNSSHSHATPWPGARIKLGGEHDGWTESELRYWDTIPDLLASAARQAADSLGPATVAGAVGRAPGIAVNRRERTPDGRTILGWNPDGVRDDSVVAIRVDRADVEPSSSEAIATLVSFACHPVVLGPEVPLVGPDFVGPLRRLLSEELRPGSVTVFLQAAAGDALPLEAFLDTVGAEQAFGRRIALEAAHAIADAEPRRLDIQKVDYGSVTPISLYRRKLAADQPTQQLASARRIVSLPLLEPPPAEELERELIERRADLVERVGRGESRVTTNPIGYHIAWLEAMLADEAASGRATAVDGEIWAARIGDCAIVGAPGEIFGAIGTAVRAASPAGVTLFAGYCNGVLGYVATPEEYPFGGYEPSVSHRGYGQPAPFSPDVAGIIERVSLELLAELFEGSRT